MSITYRQARLDDAPAVHRVWAEATNELNERHGFGGQPLRLAPPHPYFAFAVEKEPEGFWVAEDGDRVIGFAHSWVRGPLWFLAFLFVMPGYQGKGIGRHLLEQAITYGSHDRITSRALITFAYNPASISLYMRCGMYPREPLYTMTGRSESVRPLRNQPIGPGYERVTGEPNRLRDLCRIDDQVLGFAREAHHRYFLSVPGASCYLFGAGADPAGYAYVWSNGRVGPLAVVPPAHFTDVFTIALGLAASQGAENVFTVMSGANEQAVAVGLAHGMRIAYPLLLATSKPFGDWTRYLFHSAWFL